MSRTLIPRRRPRSRIASALGWIAVPWAFILLFGVDALLAVSGLPRVWQLPAIIRIPYVLIAAAPGVLWWFAPALGNVPGFGWMVETTPPTLTVDDASLTLADTAGTRSVRWDDIAHVVTIDAWPPTVRLILRDRSHLDVAGEFVQVGAADGERTTLLAELEHHRPYLVAAHRRRSLQVAAVVLAILVVLGAVAAVILVSRP